MDRCYIFWNIGTFTGHSISLNVNNGTLDGGLLAQLMIKKISDLYSHIIYELQRMECYKLQSYRYITKQKQYMKLHHHTNTIISFC